MRRIVFDVDDWIFSSNQTISVEEKVIFQKQLALYRDMNFDIVLYSSSGMIEPDGTIREQVGGLAPEIFESLASVHQFSDEIVFGKPPTGAAGLVLDDKAVTPEEFLSHDYEQIKKLISGD